MMRSEGTIEKLASEKVKLIRHAWPHFNPHKANSSHGAPIDLIGIKGAHLRQVIPCGALAQCTSSPSVLISFSALAGEEQPTWAKPHWVAHSERDGQLTNYEECMTHPSHVCVCDMSQHELESLILPMQILSFFPFLFFFLTSSNKLSSMNALQRTLSDPLPACLFSKWDTSNLRLWQ